MKSYCSSFYGSVLWDLSHVSLEDVCVIWRKGLRRVWDLPHNAHSDLLSPLCGLLPLKDELASRTCQFINKCMVSECDLVKFVVRHGIYFGKMSSPIGRNAFYCTSRVGNKLEDIGYIDKHLIRSFVESEYSDHLIYSVVSLLEMLFIKFNYHSLSLFSRNEIIDAIQCLSTAHLCFMHYVVLPCVPCVRSS
jgi:hypothetical protein